MENFDSTMKFSVEKERGMQIRDTLTRVYKALDSKGYNPVNQIVGYLLSGDPAYITSYDNARSLMRQIERDEILEELLHQYLIHNNIQ